AGAGAGSAPTGGPAGAPVGHPPVGAALPGAVGWEPVDEASAVRRLQITESLDEAIEHCRRRRLPCEAALQHLLPIACELLGARGALVRALDEQLEWRAFPSGEFEPAWFEAVPDGLPSEAQAEAEPDR